MIEHDYYAGRTGDPLHVRAEEVVRRYGGKDDLEGMATISDMVAREYPEWDEFLPAMGEILIGTELYGPAALMSSVSSGGCGGVGREPLDCPGNEYYFQDKGFHRDFQDGHNQPYHAWGYIAQTAVPGSAVEYSVGRILGIVGNQFHEIAQSALNYDDGVGTSWEDYTLSQSGMDIGMGISAEVFRPGDLGDVLRYYLGPEGPGSGGGVDKLMQRFGPLRGSPP
jgi:hypothetical protein